MPADCVCKTNPDLFQVLPYDIFWAFYFAEQESKWASRAKHFCCNTQTRMIYHRLHPCRSPHFPKVNESNPDLQFWMNHKILSIRYTNNLKNSNPHCVNIRALPRPYFFFRDRHFYEKTFRKARLPPSKPKRSYFTCSRISWRVTLAWNRLFCVCWY